MLKPVYCASENLGVIAKHVPYMVSELLGVVADLMGYERRRLTLVSSLVACVEMVPL